jgi:hypothetical protein
MVHTIGNIIPGGVKGGLVRVWNVVILFCVAREESAPAQSGIAIQIANNL